MRLIGMIATLVALLAPLQVHAQAMILDLIARTGEPLEVSSDIRLQRFADFGEAPQVEIGMRLDEGDMLSAVSGGTQLELECPPDSNSSFKLSGRFRIIITSVANDCRLDLLSGGLDVLTDADTEVNSGGAVLGTEGTQYAVRLSVRDGIAVRDVFVFDGVVAVSGIEEPQRVGALETLKISPALQSPTRGTADERQLKRTSWLYSRFDAGKAVRRGADRASVRELQAKFQDLYYQVLTRPDSENPRVQLAQTQIAYKLNNEAVYNLQRANVVNQQGFDAYRIDVDQLSEGLRPANYQLLQTRFPGSNLKYVPRPELGMQEVGAAGRGTPAPSSGDSLAPIDSGELKKSVEVLERKAREGRASSRDYYALSRALSALGDERAAQGYAEKAMGTTQTDRLLSQDQLRQINAVVKKPNN